MIFETMEQKTKQLVFCQDEVTGLKGYHLYP